MNPLLKKGRNRVLACLFLVLAFAATKFVPEQLRRDRVGFQLIQQLMPTNPTTKEGDVFYATVDGVNYQVTAGSLGYHIGKNNYIKEGGRDCRKVKTIRLGETHWYSNYSVDHEFVCNPSGSK